MTFISTPWANGDTITEVKLDQMVANEEHVRNEADFKMIVSDGHEEIAEASANSFQLEVDGASLGSGVTAPAGAGPFELYENDLNISGYSDGLRELSVVGPSGTSVIRFVKTPDINYLTYFVTLGRRTFDGDTEVYSRDLTVIAHKDTQGWTA